VMPRYTMGKQRGPTMTLSVNTGSSPGLRRYAAPSSAAAAARVVSSVPQGLTLVHFSAQPEPVSSLTDWRYPAYPTKSV